MAYEISRLAATPSLGGLSDGQASLIVTARWWVTLRKRGQDPACTMAERLGSEAAAWQFWLLMEEVGAAWPDPFMVSPPCCRRLSFDEALLLDMLGEASRENRPAFFALVGEMLSLDIAERLYRSARAFLAALPQPADG